jgi:hypothetical protein
VAKDAIHAILGHLPDAFLLSAALDVAVRDFSLIVLGTVHNVRTSPVFVTYFPGTTEITRVSLDAKLTLVGSILVKLGAETDPGIKAFEVTLRAAHDGMRAAVQAHHDALDTRAHCRSVARPEVIRWLGAYHRSHKDLDATAARTLAGCPCPGPHARESLCRREYALLAPRRRTGPRNQSASEKPPGEMCPRFDREPQGLGLKFRLPGPAGK